MSHLITYFHSLSVLLSWEVILDVFLYCSLARLLVFGKFFKVKYVFTVSNTILVGHFIFIFSFSFQISGAVCPHAFQTDSSFVVVNQRVVDVLCRQLIYSFSTDLTLEGVFPPFSFD